jgi:hypothetical protein
LTTLIRVYLPVDTEQLRALEKDRELPDRARTGFAVTARLRASTSVEDIEELEYLATQDAASAAAARGLRVVAAVDSDDDEIHELTDAESPSAVTVSGTIPRRHVASFHVLDPADQREAGTDLELSWYDATELALVLRTID